MKNVFLLNAFSLQMLEGDATVKFSEVSRDEVFSVDLVSAIGHKDTANVLGVEMNRVNVTLKKGDTAFVAQLQGGRLPEGSTTLPFQFLLVRLKAPFRTWPCQVCSISIPSGTIKSKTGTKRK